METERIPAYQKEEEFSLNGKCLKRKTTIGRSMVLGICTIVIILVTLVLMLVHDGHPVTRWLSG